MLQKYIIFIFFWFAVFNNTKIEIVQGNIPVCPADGHPICRVVRDYDLDNIHSRLNGLSYAVWDEGNDLTFVYQGSGDSVWVIYSLIEPLHQIPDTDVWVLTVHAPALQEAVISYGFAVDGQSPETFQVWRGKNAPPPAPHVESLLGSISQVQLQLPNSNTQRDVTIYLPPDHDSNQQYPVIYTVDGQSVSSLAYYVEARILDTTLPPLILIGVHSSKYRQEEYLPGVDWERFYIHEQFFIDTVRSWAEQSLGASTDRSERAVFGYSNGGVFAVAMGVRHSDLYGYVFSFSPGVNPLRALSNTEIPMNMGFFLVAGTLEEHYHRNTRELAAYFQEADAQVQFYEWVSGHDFTMWNEMFPIAANWAFVGIDLSTQ